MSEAECWEGVNPVCGQASSLLLTGKEREGEESIRDPEQASKGLFEIGYHFHFLLLPSSSLMTAGCDVERKTFVATAR